MAQGCTQFYFQYFSTIFGKRWRRLSLGYRAGELEVHVCHLQMILYVSDPKEQLQKLIDAA